MTGAVLWDAVEGLAAIDGGILPFEMLADAYEGRRLDVLDEFPFDPAYQAERLADWHAEPGILEWRRLAAAVNLFREVRDQLDGCVATLPRHPAHRKYRPIGPVLVELDAALGAFITMLMTGRARLAMPLAMLDAAAQAVEVGTGVPHGLRVITA